METVRSLSNFVDQFPQLVSLVPPTPVKKPRLIAWTSELADVFALSPDADLLSGNHVSSEMKPYSVRYGGHQFGHWAGQLGDGRVIVLGEVRDPKGEIFELQLKGAGPTPYSRSGDGRAVLRSSLREFLASEAMHHLNVPTTRALSLTLTGEMVLRDPFYDGHAQYETGAICSRMAPTFLRFGNFEILAAAQDVETLSRLTDWVIENHFKGLTRADWFREVCGRTADLMLQWLRVGFVHGVMNTDNMSILGLTIDYGPYGWLEPFEPTWTPNTTDLPGRRYAFGQQPAVALWNLERLADALSSILTHEDLVAGLQHYTSIFNHGYPQMMGRKLGLQNLSAERDMPWLQDLNAMLEILSADMTLFYRSLSRVTAKSSWDQDFKLLQDVFYKNPTTNELRPLENWLVEYKEKLSAQNRDERERRAGMNAVNPKYILRNYLAYEAAQKAERGDVSMLLDLQTVLTQPYAEQPGFKKWAEKRPEWAAQQPGSSMLSCSS